MKRILTTVLILVSAIVLRAQCPGCVPIDCSAQNPDGGLCDTIVTGMANHPLDEQISFYMPKQVYTTLLPGGGYVRLDRIQVTGITGLPLGLAWETNKSPSNEYFPQQGGDSLGCARLCGTPLQAGTFPLVVYLLADVNAPVVGAVKNQSQTYTNATIIILPDTSGGVSSFSITPNTTNSCDPLTLQFEGKINGGLNPTTYAWDFGNGATSTQQNPGSQTYSAAGTYPVSLTTSIYNFVITELRVLATNTSFSGDIEELTNLQNPDLYFTIPVLGYQSSTKSDVRSATWTGLSVEIPQGTTQFELQVWDDDNGPPFGSQDDSLGRVTIDAARGTFVWEDVNGTETEGLIILDTILGNSFSETLDITITPYSTANLSTAPADSVCTGDSITLSLSGSDAFQIDWYKDSVFVPSTDSFLTLTELSQSGYYWAEVLNSAGCRTVSSQMHILVDDTVPVPVFYINPANNMLYTINAGGIAHVQWYLDGSPIAGATRAQYIATDTGTYTVQYVNAVGCSQSMSEAKQVSTITAIDELSAGMSAVVYPNPANGRFTVRLDVKQPGNVDIVLTDNIGKQIFHATETIASLVYTKDFDFTGLPAGVYFLKVMSGKQQLTKKILFAN